MKLLIWACLLIAAVSANSETDLMRDLLGRISEEVRLTRPVTEWNETVTVSLTLTMLGIHEHDHAHSELIVDTYLMIKWQDSRLSWDPEEYGDMHVIAVPSSKIWRPDITQFNAASESLVDKDYAVALMNDGTVYYVPAHRLHAGCRPGDGEAEYSCKIIVGPWAQNVNQVDLAAPKLTFSYFFENPEWEIVSSDAERHARVYDCCATAFSDNTFILNIRENHVHSDEDSHGDSHEDSHE